MTDSDDTVYPLTVPGLRIRLHEAEAQITYYRDMWNAQRAENEVYRERLGEVPVSDEAGEYIVGLRAEVEELKDHCNIVEKDCDAYRAEVERREHEWKVSRASLDKANARVAELEAEVESLRK